MTRRAVRRASGPEPSVGDPAVTRAAGRAPTSRYVVERSSVDSAWWVLQAGNDATGLRFADKAWARATAAGLDRGTPWLAYHDDALPQDLAGAARGRRSIRDRARRSGSPHEEAKGGSTGRSQARRSRKLPASPPPGPFPITESLDRHVRNAVDGT
jgi:hypothetical protein